MTPSRGLALAVVATAAALVVGGPLRAGEPKHRTSRTVELTCRITLRDRPAGEAVTVWVPRPLGDLARDAQTVEEPLSFLKAGARTLEAGPLYFHAETAPDDSFALTWIARVERHEQLTPAAVLASPATELSADEKKTLARELEPERENAPDEEFLKLARSLAPGEKALVKIARAAYDHVIASMRYEKPPGKGWGRGSIQWACREGYGNCTDFHALFMNLCRARGIPARFVMGCSIPVGESRGPIEGYHCWAEFYVPGGHWVPVDASEAWKRPEKRDFYFGNLDPDRVALVRGRDLVLEPPQKGEPVSLLATGYAETPDGRPVPVVREMSFEDVR